MSRKSVENMGFLMPPITTGKASMEASDIKRLKELEEENRKLKQMFAELSLENHALKDVIEKKL